MGSQHDEKEIFDVARQIDSAEARSAYLKQACGDNPYLLERVTALVRIDHEQRSFLETSPPSLVATIDQPPLEKPGTRIGPYKLLEEIGEGGMGVVYVASQREPLSRTVALKIIKPGMDTREVVTRFEAERQALALMDHPNIAKVFDAGATDAGRPYFVMELVKGTPVTEFCDKHQLTTRQRLELFVGLCHGVQHAHQKGVIHRDLKPSNVLVEVHDVRPVPKIIDFGIAKAVGQHLTEQSFHTGLSQMVGTPLYMSPEQAGRSSADIDTRSDIYSLGVLLYELLTGHTPFERDTLRTAGVDEMRRIIREVDPPRPSARVSTLEAADLSTIAGRHRIEPRMLSRQLRGELDWIVMKALDKDRDRRYETANGLAADVERYLDDKPVEACPPSAMYRFTKFARRNRTALVTSALFALALILGAGVSVWQAIRATHAEQQLGATLRTAEDRLQLARTAVDEMYTQVAEKWLAQQGNLTDMQREFLEKALAFYQDFSKEEGTEPEVRNEAVVALQRVGAIQEKLGELAAAETAFVQSVKQSTDLVVQHPDRPEFRIDLAAGRLALARIYGNTGRTKEAELEADVVNGYGLTKLESTSLPDAKYRERLAQDLQRLCGELTQAYRLPEAEAAVRSALKIWESLVKDFPAEVEYRYGLAQNYGFQGMQRMWWGGQNEAAEAALREADRRLSDLQKERPDDVRFRRSLANDLTNLGVILSWTNRLDEQQEVTRRAVALFEGLAAAFPDVTEYQDGLGDALNNLAGAENHQGRNLESEEHFRAALAVSEKLADRHPDVTDNERKFGETSRALSFLLTKQEKYDEARQVLERALSRAKKALESKPAQRSPMMNVIKCSTELALSWVDLGDHAQAARSIVGLLSLFDSAGDRNRSDFPESYDKFRPGRILMSEINEKFFVGSILMNCAALAERDPRLSPTQRKQTVQTYTEQADVWFKEATAGVENCVRSRIESGDVGSFVALGGEAMIRNAEQKEHNAELSPRTREAAVMGDVLLCKALIQKAIELAPNDPDQYQIADLLTTAPEGLRDPDLALELAWRAIELKPGEAMCKQSLGWALYRSGDWKISIEMVRKPTSAESGFVLAMAYWQLGEKTEARACFDRASDWLKDYEQRCEERAKKGEGTWPPPSMLKRFQAEATALLTSAPAPVQQKPVPKAEEQSKEQHEPQKEVERSPDSAATHHRLARLYARDAQYSEALAALDQAIRLEPNKAEFYADRARIHVELAQLDQALEDSEKAIALQSGLAAAYSVRAMVLSRQGMAEKAAADWKEALTLSNNDGSVYADRGRSLAATGDFKAAIPDFTEAIRIRPQDAVPLAERGFAYAALGDEEKANADWQQAKQLDPTLAQFYFNRASAAADQQTRVAEYTKSIQLNPNQPDAFSRRGRACFNLQQFAQALADFDKLIELKPSDTLTMSWRAKVYQRLGTLDVALADAEKVIQQEPDNRNPYCERAILLRQKGDYELALADLQKVIDFGPEQDKQWFRVTKALEMRGDIYLMNLKEYDKAIEEYAKVQALEPLNAVAMNYAGALLLSGKTEEYRQACVETLERFGSSDNAAQLVRAALCCVLAPDAVTDPMQPVKLAERAVAMASKSMESLHVLGMTYLRAGQCDLAARNLHESLEAQPWLYANFNNRLGLSLVHYRRGEMEAARRWFAEATEWIDQHPDECTLVARNWLEGELLRREAQALLESAPAPQSSNPAAEEKEKTEEKRKAESGKRE